MKTDKWFEIKWILMTSLSWFVAQVIIAAIRQVAFSQTTITLLTASTLYWTVFGFVLGLFQWILIRTRIPRAFGWVIFTTMGGFLSAMLLVALSSQDLTKNILLAYPFLAYLIAGTTLGVAQYQIMKATFPQARWWILTVAFGWVIASELVSIPNTLIRLCGMLLFGALTDIVFSWLSKRTIPEAQAA